MHIHVPRVEHVALSQSNSSNEESSVIVRERVLQCRARQLQRAGKANARLSSKEVERDCQPAKAAAQLLETAMARLSLSARAYHRVLKVARTIADLANAEIISSAHVAEAVRYRELDRGAQ